MKLAKSRLKQIIKEELQKVLKKKQLREAITIPFGGWGQDILDCHKAKGDKHAAEVLQKVYDTRGRDPNAMMAYSIVMKNNAMHPDCRNLFPDKKQERADIEAYNKELAWRPDDPETGQGAKVVPRETRGRAPEDYEEVE